MNAGLERKAAELLAKVDSVERQLKNEIDEASRQSNRLFESATKLSECWSGSFFGYHSALYYRNFERPPLNNRFNPEWGGIYGIPPGWTTPGSEVVKTHIEQEANTQFDELGKKTKEMSRVGQELQSEILVSLSPLRELEGFLSEKKLLDEVEHFKWETKAANYAHDQIPKQLMSRDSSAVAEGAKYPPHLYYEAEAHEDLSRCTLLTDFFKLAKRFLGQVQAQMSHSSAANTLTKPGSIELVKLVCARFHFVARQFLERRGKRPTLRLQDEYDVQDLLRALLNINFDDIRPEEWTPSYAGTTSRMDFLLKADQIVIEAKMTRSGRANKEIADELAIDTARYKTHQDCKTLVCFVYDPNSVIKNPRGFETDIARLSDSRLTVIAIVAP